jgi:hypothetical protein
MGGRRRRRLQFNTNPVVPRWPAWTGGKGAVGRHRNPRTRGMGAGKPGWQMLKGAAAGQKGRGVGPTWWEESGGGGSPDDKGCAQPVAAQNMGLIGQLTGGSGLLCWQFNQSQWIQIHPNSTRSKQDLPSLEKLGDTWIKGLYLHLVTNSIHGDEFGGQTRNSLTWIWRFKSKIKLKPFIWLELESPRHLMHD